MALDPDDPTIIYPPDGGAPYRETLIHYTDGTPSFVQRSPVVEAKIQTVKRRFDGIKPGDQLEQSRYGKSYWIVTDTWFDPVKGQNNPQQGDMVAIQQINHNTGNPRPSKTAHTIRGLASNGYTWASRDWMSFFRSRLAAHQEGTVVGIGHARTIRKRPKSPGGSF